MSSSPSSFPFFKLPLLAIQNVIGNIDHLLLIHLTMKFKKFKRTVNLFKLPVARFEWYLTTLKTEIKLDAYGTPYNETLIIEIQETEAEDSKNVNIGIPAKMATPTNERKISTDYSCDITWTLYSEGRPMLEILEALTTHLMKVTVVRDAFDISYHLPMNHLTRDFFIWKFLTRPARLHISGVSQDPLKMTPEELQFILKDVNSKNFNLNVQVINETLFPWKYNEPIRHSWIILLHCNWLETTQVLSLECPRIQIHLDNRPLDLELNMILKKWMAENGDVTESVYFKFEKVRRVPSQRRVFDGITTMDSVVLQDRDGKSLVMVAERVLRDIKRATDGRRATVAWNKERFHLLIWNHNNIRYLKRETRERFEL